MTWTTAGVVIVALVVQAVWVGRTLAGLRARIRALTCRIDQLIERLT